MDEGSVHDTLILSDLHLGSECSRAREATRLLKESRFRRLILLGDIFANLDFRRLTKEQWKFLGQIRKLSNPKRNIEVVWVEGNHDEGLTEIMSALVGVQVYQEYAWEYSGLQHLAIHGHQFDRFVVNNLRLNHFWTVIYLKLQKFDLKGKPVARFIDRLNTRWLRMSSKVASGAVLHARSRGAERIFCGHTHEALQQQQDGIQYYNAGGWIDSRQTYITIGTEGVRIHEYHDRSEDRDSSKEDGDADSAMTEFAESGLPEDAEYQKIGG
jgi:UDP-2,3-diacylglucosamine pyrophosphatase LpxH